MLEKINKIKNWQAIFIILAVGFTVFFTGLTNPFQGDDINQIINSVPVHSISNITHFFTGGTFYYGQGLKLEGGYYRPLMTTTFSIIYTIFGAHPIYFHLLQLFICIGSAILLYLFFRYSFKPVLSLFLALVFLIHPIDSQVVYAIPSMQDALFFFFGILAMYLLIRFNSIRSLFFVAASLFLCLLSKETGIVFVAMALIYLFQWNRKRIYPFIAINVLPIALWLFLRIHAVGFNHNPGNAQIDNLSLAGRLLTAPSIIMFYVVKLIFPLKLASAYYWTYPSFSIRHVLIPTIFDLAIIAVLIYLGLRIHKQSSKAQFYTYIFFAVWAALGFLTLLQITPLDMTACETWIYFSVAGILGMAGTVTNSFKSRFHIDSRILVAVMIFILVLLGARTALRGTDWSNSYKLAKDDIAASPQDWDAETIIATNLAEQGNIKQAQTDAYAAVRMYPTLNTYMTLGTTLVQEGNYAGAKSAYLNALRHQEINSVYEDLGALTVWYGNPTANKALLLKGLEKFPQDGELWLYLAILEDRNNNNADAKLDITQAANYGAASPYYYDNIMNDKPLMIPSGPIISGQ